MADIQYLDYEGLLRYHELIDAQKANKSEIADVLRYSTLTLTTEQKALARANIGAGTGTVTSTAHTITVKSGKKADGTTDITATSSSATSPSVTLGSSGATAGAYGDTSNQTPSAGATFKVPSISVNAQGIVTAVAEHTVKIPAATQNTDNTGIKLDTVSGTKKTDTTVIKAGSSTGLSIAGGTNKFSIGDGTNYIEVPITPSISNNVTGSAAWTASDKIVVTNASSGNAIKATSVAVGDLAPKASPALTGTPTAPTATAGTNNTQIATTAFVQNAISGITDAMVFQGTIGKATSGSGTISALPTSGVKIGHTYKIVDENKSIAAANSATGAAVTAKIGDTIVATDATPKWVVIPSGDEPSGTVTSIKIQATGPIAIDSNAAITSSGTRTISHATSGVTAGTYGPSANVTGSNNATINVPEITVDSTGHVTSVTNRVYTSVNNTYTVGNKALKISSDSGTALNAISMNENSADRTLKIGGDGTWITGAVSGSANAPVVTLTHGTASTGSALTTTDGDAGAYALNTEYTVLTGVTISADANGHITGVSTTRQKVKDTNTTYSSQTAASGGTAVSLVTTGEKYTWNNKQNSVAKLGSTTKPLYTSAAGTFAECSTYAGGTAVTLNGSSKAASTASFYAPTSVGTSGLILTSSGNGAPTWGNISTITYGSGSTLDSTKQIDSLFITT